MRYFGTLAAAIVLLASIASTSPAQTPPSVSFVARRDFLVGQNPGEFGQGIAADDFNADGKLDIATANFSSNDVSILLGNADGTFQPAVSYPVDTAPFLVMVADFNGDGHLDILTANQGNSTTCRVCSVSILLGNGDGTFQSQILTAITGQAFTLIAIADFVVVARIGRSGFAGVGGFGKFIRHGFRRADRKIHALDRWCRPCGYSYVELHGCAEGREVFGACQRKLHREQHHAIQRDGNDYAADDGRGCAEPVLALGLALGSGAVRRCGAAERLEATATIAFGASAAVHAASVHMLLWRRRLRRRRQSHRHAGRDVQADSEGDVWLVESANLTDPNRAVGRPTD